MKLTVRRIAIMGAALALLVLIAIVVAVETGHWSRGITEDWACNPGYHKDRDGHCK